MEKRDLLVILAAICIVLLLAMYVKPLITGQEVKLIPDELERLISGSPDSTQDERIDDSFFFPTPTPEPGPSYSNIIPDSFAPDDSNATIEIIGRGFTPSMSIIVDKDGANQTLSTRVEDDRLVAYNLSLNEGRWVVKFFDSRNNVTYTTQHVVNVIPTPTPDPGWDGVPKPLTATITEQAGTYLQTRAYPKPLEIKETPMKTYINFGGVSSVVSDPIPIPYNYWDIVYTVDYRTEIANPADGEVFEFNRQYKEPLVMYEGEPLIIYERGSSIPTLISTKSKVESEKEFRASSDTVITKKLVDDTIEIQTSGSVPSLVESVGYLKPYIEIKLVNANLLGGSDIIIKPEGGIDPLQWNEAKHKEEAEKILKEKGKEELLNSEEYKDNWEKKWKTIKDPRPWKERIYGSGNYILEVTTHDIDSYNIQILVPEDTEEISYLTSDPISAKEQENIKKLFRSFSEDYNADVTPGYFSNLSDYLVTDLIIPDLLKPIYSNYTQVRASGQRIKDITIYDIMIRGSRGKDNNLLHGNDATVKGSFLMEKNGVQRYVPIDVEIINYGTSWKFKTVPEIRD